MRMEPLSDGGLAYEIRLPGDLEWKPFLRFSFEEARLSSPGGFTREQWL